MTGWCFVKGTNNMNYYDLEPGKYPDDKNKENEDEYIGNGWSVKRVDDFYMFEYISGALQGILKRIHISQEDFLAAKAGKITFDELCIKYNVS